MSEQDVHVFIPSMDGEYMPVSFTSKDLKDKEVFIILDESDRHIFIWTGINSSVRKRFISSQIARQIRLEKGMTHRISTEEQGNETNKFTSLMERISGHPIKANKSLDVSPLAITSHPDTLREISPSKKDILNEEKFETLKIPDAPLKPPVPVPVEEEKPVKKPVEVIPPETLYFSDDVNIEIVETKAQMICPSADENLTLTTLHISSASTKGKISFYYLPTSAKTASCKNKKPIFAVYLTPTTPPVLELDDLEIPIPAGNSLYFTCPVDTFIAINLV
ncbi:MAG: hypothetical protein ACFFAU_19580 [Candidatus Hodarchaeota archaeon]